MKKIKQSTTIQIVIATIAGVVFGSLVGEWSSNLKFIGDIFIRLIQMSVVVLVMTSVISAIGDMGRDKSESGIGFKMGLNGCFYREIYGYIVCFL